MAAKHIVAFPLVPQNPYQALLYEALEGHGFSVGEGDLRVRWLVRNRRRAHVLHFHWPQSWFVHRAQPGGPLTALKLTLFTGQLLAARALGYKIAWTVHEVYPLNPAAKWADRGGSRVLARLSHVLLANDHETAEQARKELGRAAAKVEVVPHPSYLDAYPEGRSRQDVRSELGIAPDGFTFLLFGHITEYKRVETFVDAFRAADLPDDAALVVAGLNQHEPSAAHVRAAASQDPRIKPLLEFIPDDRVAELFGASDAAIAPRQDGGTSGALVLALSMGLPVISADHPTYRRVTDGETAAYVYAPWDQASMAVALGQAASDPEGARAKGEAGRALVAPLTWENLAKTTAGLLERAMHPRRRATPTAAPAGESA
jgi:glycosyltransferase involved in cell wall biosynthesis